MDKAASGDVGLAELTYEHNGKALNLAAGQLNEQGMLGGYSRPILGLNQGTTTFGMSLSGAWALDQHWALTGAINHTSTAAPTPTGMLLAATGVQAQSYGIGLVRGDTWRNGDRLSFAVNAPLRARSGTLTYDVVTGVDNMGAPIYGRHLVNLAPTAQEWTMETRYATRVSRHASLSFAAALRVNPDHDGQAPSQLALGLRYSVGF